MKNLLSLAALAAAMLALGPVRAQAPGRESGSGRLVAPRRPVLPPCIAPISSSPH